MKAALSTLKIIFLSILLSVNVIGFHYYFSPVADANLKFIPEGSKFVISFNLKSISGKLFNEFLFNADDFEKEILTKDEKNLVFENSNYGIDPFGWVSFFSFDFESRMIHGLSINLENPNAFKGNVEKSSIDRWTVDDILIYKNEKSTVFVFDQVAVILFEQLGEEVAGDIGVKFLQNQENDFVADSGKDFFMNLKTGVFKKSTFHNFFRLIPDFAEGIYLEGEFGKGSVAMEGFVGMKQGALKPDRITFEKADLEKTDPFLISIEGKNISKIIQRYLNGLFSDEADTTGYVNGLLKDDYSALKYTVNKLNVSTDLFGERGFMPEYSGVFGLVNGKEQELTSFSLEGSLLDTSFNNPNRIFARMGEKYETKRTSAYFYMHPRKFIESSELNFFIKNILDPFIVFEEIILNAEKYEGDKLFIKGESTFIDKDVHSLIQLRLLFKNLTSLI